MKNFYHKSGDDVKIATMYTVSTHKVAILTKHYIVKYFVNVLYIE